MSKPIDPAFLALKRCVLALVLAAWYVQGVLGWLP